MQDTPLVTAIVPVFNRAWCLRRALDSVRAQSWRPLEIIIVDDGSTDETPELIKAFAAQNLPDADASFRVRIVRQENRGVSAARNAAIRLARGEYIALLDSDDAWKPDKTAKQVQLFLEDPRAMLNQTDEDWIRNGVFVNKPRRLGKTSGDLFKASLDHCAVSPSAVMMRRALFDEVGLFDEDFPACEDYEMWLRVTARHAVGLVEEPLLIKYGGHEDQLSRTVEALDRYRIAAIVKTLDAGILDLAQTRQAIEALREKSRIYALGARKRGKAMQADEVEELARHYTKIFLQE